MCKIIGPFRRRIQTWECRDGKYVAFTPTISFTTDASCISAAKLRLLFYRIRWAVRRA